MTAPTYEFVQLDVFTRTALTGNPLAIFTNARGRAICRANFGGTVIQTNRVRLYVS
jgi:hypothetical protein